MNHGFGGALHGLGPKSESKAPLKCQSILPSLALFSCFPSAMASDVCSQRQSGHLPFSWNTAMDMGREWEVLNVGMLNTKSHNNLQLPDWSKRFFLFACSTEDRHFVGRIGTCAGRPQWISSPSPQPLGHDNLVRPSTSMHVRMSRAKRLYGTSETYQHNSMQVFCFSLLTECFHLHVRSGRPRAQMHSGIKAAKRWRDI